MDVLVAIGLKSLTGFNLQPMNLKMHAILKIEQTCGPNVNLDTNPNYISQNIERSEENHECESLTLLLRLVVDFSSDSGLSLDSSSSARASAIALTNAGLLFFPYFS